MLRLRELTWHLGGGVLAAFVLDGLRFLYLWGHDEHPSLHFIPTVIAGLVVGSVYHAISLILLRRPVMAAKLRRLAPWDALAPRFRRAKLGLNPLYIVIGLSYAAYYLIYGLENGRPWATWINNNIFHFVLFGRTYGASDILPFDILGYSLLLLASWLFKTRCPPMFARSPKRTITTGDPELTPFEFSDTIGKIGLNIPARDHFLTLAAFVKRNQTAIDAIPDPERNRLYAQLAQMDRAVDNDQRQLLVGAAIEFARLLPTQSAKDIYVTGQNLFNTVRWRARFAILGMSTASVLLAGIPVIYHLLWMIFRNPMERPL